MKLKSLALLLSVLWLFTSKVEACAVLYYIDATTGKIYIVNNEDYWYDVNAYIQIEPKSKNKWARLWYGWDKFAQGGVNEVGLFFDAAVTPEQEKVPGYGNPNSNLGNEILAHCATVDEALLYIEKRKTGLTKSHMMFGDKSGKAVVVEWVGGKRELHWVVDNRLIMTNFLLSDTTAGNYPCYRYHSIEERIQALEKSEKEINLLSVGNTFGQAGQPARADESGRLGGTVYTSFISLTDMKFVLSYKLSNENVVILDLGSEFSKPNRQKIKLRN
ncbi:penicillin acylase [Reichenbachiella carrageenanivorans]|uniref:Penicillin acylase n=1 Tax=Reichenbachiella carrageenanivorans TaxID=2979869 RepID=A0ABY6CXW1_9BACT|nr:penicillin acylase [Reichenbachiella carrageenanivorans]UXX78713.1 penicillin acylase [Reichenbachiella carrageenanivorans]